jgi:nuclear autoantigenic sperm protein
MCDERTSENVEAKESKASEESEKKTEEASSGTIQAGDTEVKPSNEETTTTEKKEVQEEKKESTEIDGEAEGEEANGEEEEEGEEVGEGEAEVEEEGEDITKADEKMKDDEDADDISNLQRAWEMFELAKVVYSKSFNDDLEFKNKRIAECLLKLGEISIEQELYDQAIGDINESVKLQEQIKENRDERMLAETFYQLALAYQFNAHFNEAKESFDKSINIVQLRIEMLKSKLEQTQDDLDKQPIRDEINELEALLPEMLTKLEEVSEQGKETMNLIKEAKECFVQNQLNGENKKVDNGDVKDITNLVKSKRKASSSDQITNESKKTKVDNQTSSEETTTNGHEKMDDIKTAENGDNNETTPKEQPIDA